MKLSSKSPQKYSVNVEFPGRKDSHGVHRQELRVCLGVLHTPRGQDQTLSSHILLIKLSASKVQAALLPSLRTHHSLTPTSHHALPPPEPGFLDVPPAR